MQSVLVFKEKGFTGTRVKPIRAAELKAKPEK
jgi:hypothetical protein